jgi:integrase
MPDDKWSNKFTKCVSCNTTLHPHKAKGLCNSCYQKEHEYPKSECSICGKVSRIHKIENGNVICSKCYKQPLHTCSICNKQASAAVKLNMTEYVCDSCYTKHYRNKQICSICGKSELLAINSIDKKVCVKCYSSPNNLCSRCGRNIESPYIVNGTHVCSRCYENFRQDNTLSNLNISKESYTCSICGNLGSVHRIYNDNSVICQSCYAQQSSICVSCNNSLLPIHSHLDALPYCRNCYYKGKFDSMLKELKKNWSDSFSIILEDYFSNKALNVSYETTWEHIKVSEDLLSDLHSEFINSNFSFSPSRLIEVAKNHTSRKLFFNDFTAYLCSNSILSDYDNGLVLLDNLNEQIGQIPVAFQKVIITYKMSLLEKLIKYKEKGWTKGDSRFSYYTCYLYLLTSLRFLSFVNALKLQQPTEISNHTVDAFIRLKPYDKGNLRHFITYMNKNKITFMQLKLPYSNYKHELHVSISDERQRKIIETCLYNDNILLRNRVIVILMLLYGITPEEIRALKKSNFTISKPKTKTIFCNNHTKHEMPPILSSLILMYLDSLTESLELVFPGRLINSPISLSSICRIMKSFKVTAKELFYTSINNAMINGLYQPALLMKSFGISYITATRFHNLVRLCYE